MFNVTVIRGKDIVKILIILFVISILFKFSISKVSVKNMFNKSISIDTNAFLELGINSGSNLIKEVQKNDIGYREKLEDEEVDFDEASLKYVLELGSNAFRIKEASKLGQDEKGTSYDAATANDIKEEKKDLEPAKTDLSTEVVTPNPIKETYSQEYNGIKIRNETSFELTDDILNPDSLEIDKSNILIFHTHTCESYTQSDNYKYEPTRKL